MFGMKAYLINMHLLVPRPRSSAKVKVNIKVTFLKKLHFSKNCRFRGICVSQTNLVFPWVFSSECQKHFGFFPGFSQVNPLKRREEVKDLYFGMHYGMFGSQNSKKRG